MTDKQIKEGDLVVFRSRIDCQKALSAEYGNGGDIKSLYVTDNEKSTFLEWEERANDPVIELHASFEDVLSELKGFQETALEDYGTWYVILVVTENFGKWRWRIRYWSGPYKENVDGGWENASVIDWETTDEEVEEVARLLIDNAVEGFTLI